MGAKHEFTQQIFTKTMTLQVWKPEHERPGRHFVYTTRYVSFFVRVLVQLGDRASLEALTKRVRKKAGEYVGFAKLWHDICLAYLKVRRLILCFSCKMIILMVRNSFFVDLATYRKVTRIQCSNPLAMRTSKPTPVVWRCGVIFLIPIRR